MNRQAPTETPPVDLDNFSRKRVKMKLVTKANPIRNVETSPLTFSEQVQACCTIAREKLEAGDYDAGCAALRPWWKIAVTCRRCLQVHAFGLVAISEEKVQRFFG